MVAENALREITKIQPFLSDTLRSGNCGEPWSPTPWKDTAEE